MYGSATGMQDYVFKYGQDERKDNKKMSEKELIAITIDRYTDLQQIKKANGGHENQMLDYFIKVTIAKLLSLGVNVEDITL